MIATTRTALVVTSTLRTGRIVSTFVALFLAFDSVIKVLKLAPAVEATTILGYPAQLVVVIGVIEIVCLAAYVIPRTALLGAILLTGYLGGAVASQLRAETPVFQVVFPLMMGALIWGGLLLRDARLRAHLLPW